MPPVHILLFRLKKKMLVLFVRNCAKKGAHIWSTILLRLVFFCKIVVHKTNKNPQRFLIYFCVFLFYFCFLVLRSPLHCGVRLRSVPTSAQKKETKNKKKHTKIKKKTFRIFLFLKYFISCKKKHSEYYSILSFYTTIFYIMFTVLQDISSNIYLTHKYVQPNLTIF